MRVGEGTGWHTGSLWLEAPLADVQRLDVTRPSSLGFEIKCVSAQIQGCTTAGGLIDPIACGKRI